MIRICFLLLSVLVLLPCAVLAQAPFVTTVDDNPAPGIIYTANLGGGTAVPIPSEIVKLDSAGTILQSQPVYPQNWHILDVQLQPNGLLTYGAAKNPGAGGAGGGLFYVLDPVTWAIKDSLQSSSFATDVHELRMFSDGSYALIGLTDTMMARKDIYPGSTDTSRMHVNGNTVEIFNAQKQNIFLWRGIDHYHVADAQITGTLTADTSDFEHANAIDFDANGNILLSNRHLCELTQINRQTGEIMWRLGGRHNQFTLLQDSVWFSYQHCARWLPNGHLMLFDNGNYDTVAGVTPKKNREVSRAVEYELDTTTKTIKAVWEYRHTPDISGSSSAMGSVERLADSNTLIDWGIGGAGDIATEVKPDGSTALELTISSIAGGYDACYRVFKYPLPSAAVRMAAMTANSMSVTYGSNSMATLHYNLDQGEPVSIALYDLMGRAVRTMLPDEFESPGSHDLALNLSALPPGSYYCVLRGGNLSIVTPMQN